MMIFLGFVCITLVFGTLGYVRKKRQIERELVEYLLYMDERRKIQEAYKKQHEELVKKFKEIEE